MDRRWRSVVALLFWLSGAAAQGDLEAVVGLRALARLRPGQAYLASSADPTGGNNDRGHFVRREGAEEVLLEVPGPGVITRFWSANPQGTLRIYFDAERQPRVAMPLDRLGDFGAQTPTVPGFVSRAGGGVSCWFPMPFARGCKVTVEGGGQLYYQINYTRLPNAAYGTFKPGPYRPAAGEGWGASHERTVSVPAGGRGVLAELSGPATITRLLLEVAPARLATLRPLRLRLSWEGGPPAVDVPLLDFFACGLGAGQLVSAPIAVAGWNLFQSEFPMPFARRGRVELLNQGGDAVTVRATALATPGVAPGSGYFQAAWRSAVTVAGQPYQVARLRGRGQYVGTAVTLGGPAGLTHLEGDETFVVDGGRRLQGTGTEDYFDGAWFFRRGPFSEPYAGAPLQRCGKSALTAYRWHVADAIPFSRSLDVLLEHGPGNDSPGARYRSVAYWYASQPAAVAAPRVPELPPACEAAAPGVVEAEGLAPRVSTTGATATVVDDAQASLRAGGGRLLRVVFTARQGAAVTLPLQVPATGLYDLALALVAGGPEFGLTVKLDDTVLPPPTEPPVIGNPLLALGRTRLTKGDHRLSLLATPWENGAGPVGVLGIDALLLTEVAKVKEALEAEDLTFAASGGAAEVRAWDTLPPTVVRADEVIGGGVPTEALPSGGAQVLFQPKADGDRCEVTFSVDEAGDYGLAAGLGYGPDGGEFAVLLDGRTIVPRATARRAALAVGGRLGLGTRELAAGPHKLALQAAEQLGPLVLDYLLLEPARRGHEAELLAPLDLAGGRVVIKERFGAEPRWSGGAYLRVVGGQGAKLALFAPRAGRYELAITPARVPGGGEFTVQVPGGAGAALSSRGDGEATGAPVMMACQLARGLNTLVFQPRGAGELALDVVELRYRGWPASWMVGAVVAGSALLALLLALLRRRARR